MPRILFYTIALAILGLTLTVSAQESQLTEDQLESKLGSIKNPFESQLPVKIEKVDVVEIDPILNTNENKQPPPKQNAGASKPNKVNLIPVKPKETIVPLPELTVSGIIWNSDRPQAIMNGHVVNIGDTFLEIKITDIQKTVIEGEFHGRTITISTQRSSL